MEKKYRQILSSQIEDVTGYEQIWEAEMVEQTSLYWPYWDNEELY
jgi:hypothetical protein